MRAPLKSNSGIPTIEVEVRLPEQSGSDWNDVLMAQNQTSFGAQACLAKT